MAKRDDIAQDDLLAKCESETRARHGNRESRQSPLDAGPQHLKGLATGAIISMWDRGREGRAQPASCPATPVRLMNLMRLRTEPVGQNAGLVL